jgi:excisionase family DNA binding protein
MKVVAFPSPRLITFHELAKVLGISYSAAYALAKRGEIPYVELPSSGGKRAGRLMFDVRELDSLIARWRKGAA